MYVYDEALINVNILRVSFKSSWWWLVVNACKTALVCESRTFESLLSVANLQIMLNAFISDMIMTLANRLKYDCKKIWDSEHFTTRVQWWDSNAKKNDIILRRKALDCQRASSTLLWCQVNLASLNSLGWPIGDLMLRAYCYFVLPSIWCLNSCCNSGYSDSQSASNHSAPRNLAERAEEEAMFSQEKYVDSRRAQRWETPMPKRLRQNGNRDNGLYGNIFVMSRWLFALFQLFFWCTNMSPISCMMFNDLWIVSACLQRSC